MHKIRPYCISIAGMDPSAGAGILADIKTFENLQVYGLGVVTSLTYQNENEFSGINWYDISEIEKQLGCLRKYEVKAIKIGLIKNFKFVEQIAGISKSFFPDAYIVWDPILKASTGFNFHKQMEPGNILLEHIDLITPNLMEYEALKSYVNMKSCSVLLKGGHSKTEKGTDTLITPETEYLIPGDGFHKQYDKHGSGCVLSAAIAANLALGMFIHEACKAGKTYVEKFLQSNTSKLGYHS